MSGIESQTENSQNLRVIFQVAQEFAMVNGVLCLFAMQECLENLGEPKNPLFINMVSIPSMHENIQSSCVYYLMCIQRISKVCRPAWEFTNHDLVGPPKAAG